MKQKLFSLAIAFLMGLTAVAQTPKADLLDVVFNDDGTATDVSAMQSEITVVGAPYVVKSLKYGINEACFRNNIWGDTPKGYFRVDYEENQAFRDALATGHSFEALIRPLPDPKNYAVTSKFFSNQQTGGGSLSISSSTQGAELFFADFIGEANKNVYSEVVPEPGKYYHVVGTWDKEEGIMSIYVNGELARAMDVDGAYQEPKEGSMWFCIGADPSTNDNATNAFTGDIAIARVYSSTLSAADVDALYKAVQDKDTGADEHADEQEYDPYLMITTAGKNSMEMTELDEPYSYHLETTGADPYIYWSALQKTLGEDETVLTFEYKCPMGAPSSEFFLSPIVGGREFFFDIPAADDWTPFYLDMANPMASFEWGAFGDNLRLDLGLDAGITMDIRNIHFITKTEYLDIIGSDINLEQDADGFYLVGSAEELIELARVVNIGLKSDIQVRQTADIDLGNFTWTPIGKGSGYGGATGTGSVIDGGFAGLYDGQGHIVSNFIIDDSESEATGLFGVVTGTVKNLGIDGAQYNATKDCRAGGLVGTVTASGTSTGLVENCFVMNSSILTGSRVCGGLAGAVYGGVVQNCYAINNELSGYGDRFGGIAGDTRSDGSWNGTVNNCYTDFGRVTSSQAGSTTKSQGNVSAARFASGEIAYLLNGSTVNVNSAWRQNIEEDASPVTDPTHGYILSTGDSYFSLSEANYEGARDDIVNAEYEYCANVVCAQSLIEEYESFLETVEQVQTIEDFFSAYENMLGLKKILMESAGYYAAYQAKVDEVRANLEGNDKIVGEKRDQLQAYLDQEIAPNETYPNGSYTYILDTRALDNEGIEAETAFVQKMLNDAIASGYTEGADVTRMMTNPDFSDGTNGWTIENGSLQVSNVADASAPYVAYSNDRTCVSQTLTGLLPGVYQVTVKAAYRAASDNENLNQTAFLFANNNKVYVPTVREGAIPADSESPNLSRYVALVGEFDEEILGYVPTSTSAMAFAFSEGYYESTIVAVVGEDGTLTLGVNTLGCNATNETWIGAFSLKYCGEAASATSMASYKETVDCQAARLSTLANDYNSDSFDYSSTPNYSKELQDKVVEAVGKAQETETPTLEMVTSLGDLMQEVYDCKQAYAVMLSKAEIVLDLYSNMHGGGLLTEEEETLMLSGWSDINDAYVDGSYTYEQALAANPFTGLSFVPTIDNNTVKIANAKELIVFASLVNSGFHGDLNAVLTDDIDMEGINFYTPIGLTSVNYGGGQALTEPGYQGTFDGQGHVIKNLKAVYNTSYCVSGVFGTVTGTVKNLGVVNYHFDISESETPYGGRFGALCGVLVEGTILNCYVTGSQVIDANEIVSAIAAGNYGGVIQNCYEYGNTIRPHTRAGQLVGDARDDGNVRIGTEINCYSEGFVTGAGKSGGYASNMEGCENQVAAARFKSGEIAYKLNGGATDINEVVWFQTITEDESPVLDNSHYIVRLTESGNYTNFDDTNAALLALIQEAQGLVDYARKSDPKPLILDGSQLSENCLWQPGYEIEKVIDGEQSTYFHSRTDTPLANGTEYFQVSLNAPITGFDFEIYGRSDGEASGAAWHDTPDQFRIMVTNTPADESSWKEVATNSYPVPNGHGAYYRTEEPVMFGGEYQYIRLYVLHSTNNCNYWNMTEFQMFDANDPQESLYSTQPEVAEVVDKAEPAMADKLQLAKAGTGTQADIDEMQNVVDELRAVLGIAKPHSGTKDDPYEIATAQDFVNLHGKMRTGDITYVILTDDIDMSEVSDWICLNDAQNTADGKGWMNWIDFNGCGHVIRNFTSTSATGYGYASVFGVLCGSVRNVGFENVNVDCTDTGSGVLGGYIGHDNFSDADGNKHLSVVENVWVTGKLHVASSYCGGLFGNIGGPSIIKNCYTNLEINSDASYVGGIVGRVRSDLTIENVYAAGTMNKGGGIVGGGQNASTPASKYTNCVVWNNATNFGSTVDGDEISGVSYYDGSNFAALQQVVVGWGSPWTCDMAEGSYPTFDQEVITGIQQIAVTPAARISTISNHIYTMDGRMVKANATAADVKSLPKGLYIVGGRKVVVK